MPTNAPRLQIANRDSAVPAPATHGKQCVRSNLRASMGDGASYSVMVALGETFFQPFAVALATGETLVGLVATLPMLLGSVIQLFAPAGLRRFGSHKWWIVGTSTLQALAMLLLPLAILFPGSWGTVWIIAAITMYWASVQSAGPAWNTWIEGILPRKIRTPFLACRARISQTCSLLGFLAGGLAVQAASVHWTDRSQLAPTIVLLTYAGLFIVAAAARFVSVACLAAHREPAGEIAETGPTMLQFFTGRSPGTGRRLIFYLLAMQVAVQISGPFFYPFLLQEMKISFFTFMTLVTIGFLGKVIALPMWGRVAATAGARRLFWLGGSAIVPVSGLWIFAHWFESWQFSLPLGNSTWQFSGSIVYLGFVQLLSGITWGAYELAMTLMFLESIPRQNRTTVLTYYNFGNSSAMMLGSLIGGSILWSLGESYFGYLVLFALSSTARLVTIIAFANAPETPRIEDSPADPSAVPQLRVISAESDDETAASVPVRSAVG